MLLQKIKKYRLEIVEWIDAQSECEWAVSIDDFNKSDLVITDVGFIVYEDRKSVVICSQISSDGDFGNRTKIPKPWIKSRRRIDGQGTRTPFGIKTLPRRAGGDNKEDNRKNRGIC